MKSTTYMVANDNNNESYHNWAKRRRKAPHNILKPNRQLAGSH